MQAFNKTQENASGILYRKGKYKRKQRDMRMDRISKVFFTGINYWAYAVWNYRAFLEKSGDL